MKRHLIIKALFVFGLLSIASQTYAQTGTQNYIESITHLDTINIKKIRTVQYFDGLGRSKQIVNVKASPTGKDVVTPILYDGFGRQTRDYLPVPQQSTTNGAIYGQNSDLIDFPVGDPAGIYQGEKAFSEKTLENSPLDRLLEQKQVGTAWNGKPVKFEYATNTSTDIRKYVTTTTSIGDITTSVLNVSNDSNSLNGFYKANQLYKNSVKDEDGNETIEFKNGRGQTVLVRKVINATDNADTYYIYNEYSQLAFVIPPKASFAIKGLGVGLQIADTTLNDLCYQYRYDGKNRLVEKKLPGKGWEYMVYDKADRLILTQDAELRKINKWLVTKYDLLGRVVYTGIFSSLEGRPSLQSLLNNYVITEYRNAQGFTKNGMQIYYSKDFVDLETVLSVNYYDNYLTGDPFPTLVFDQTVLPSDVQQYGRSTKGLPVSSFVKNIEDDSWTKNYFYYDLKGRSIREFTLNHLGGYTNVEKQLDFSGVVKEILTQHKRLATDTEKTIREKFTYDDQNRLISHSHQVGAGAIEFLARNKYNELSQLEYKKVGGTVTAPLQQVDYKYNIRGWVTQINDPNALGGDLFGYKIKYNQVEGQESPNMDYSTLKVLPKYNGNIAEVDWKTSTIPNDNLRRYGYVYDNLNRLVAGFYQKDTNPSAKEYFEMMEYDLNGNITNLKRSADVLSGDPNTKLIDNLKYDYTGNKLTKVTEQQQNSTGYPYFVAPNEIGYDLNGSMISYKDKDLELIEYNFLNLPSKITGKPGQTQKNTTNLYRADGVKIRKIFSASSAMITQTDYLDGFQYKDAVLQFVPSAEGYYDFVKNKYIYNYTDHLGNVRLSYQKGTSGLEVIEENNYYPFGLKHEGYNGLAGNSAYQWKYNGKELQETGMYNYGARFYMPDIGRWGVVDPLAEKMTRHSPYNYAFNNPLRFIDPDGRDPIDYVNENGKKIGTDGTDVEGTLMVKNKDDQKAITTAEKNGQHIGTDKLSELNIGMVVPPDSTLKESLNVLARGDANGGLREESSSIAGDGVITQGTTGPLPTVDANGIGTAPASLPTNANTHTTIHLHPTGMFEANGLAYPFNALTPTQGTDSVTFSGKGTNIIVGRLEVANATNVTKNPNGTYNDYRPVGAAIYRGGNATTPAMVLTKQVMQNIINRNGK
ncbi:RHS repeat-associated core domain-containing protein [Chryseobacterium paludis]|uniref:RHS repeat-associated core domain-containing protein n=1 Tax=Chryseobacterium paludis TaxID=2956784 RepID=UPI0021BEF599|nr:RHS repeat-associated core domain-containing protein [Chryseobacterium paludis]